MKKWISKCNRGFSLVEGLISAAIFVMLAMTIYGTVASIIKGITAYRSDVVTSNLADQYMEIVRNMPYAQIGSLSGNPHGTLPDLPNALNLVIDGVTYKIYYVVNYIDDPSDGTILAGTDPSPNDYKQVKMYVINAFTGKTNSFLTNVSPKSLEGLDNGGAIYVKVIDSVGQPVPTATVHITNAAENIDLTRTTDANGHWIEVAIPSGNNSYHIAVTKSGYSADQTYPITTQNPNPIKPDSTVNDGTVTEISFSIDKVSTFNLLTLDQYCSPIPSVGMEVRGVKLIGIAPNVFKFDNLFTSNSLGKISLKNLEWDNYTPALTSSGYTIYGSSPIQQINILPATEQTFTFILAPKTNNNLLVIVKDYSTKNPVEGAKVEMSSDITGFDDTKYTGGSIWEQSLWTGGGGQNNFIDDNKKYLEGQNISTNDVPEALRLASFDGGHTFAPSGYLVSSTFDTGTASSTYTALTWQPASQNPTTTVKFQIATNNDNATWNFLGPDKTANTYYIVSGSTIVSDAARYVRYKVFLETSDIAITPVLTNINVNYVSGCFTPGQVIFTSLNLANDYKVKVSKSGYIDQTISNLHITPNNANLDVLLTN